MPKYVVISATCLQMYTTEEPQNAVRAFFNEFRSLGPSTEVSVFVADYIGKFRRTETIERLPNVPPPRITKPDR